MLEISDDLGGLGAVVDVAIANTQRIRKRHDLLQVVDRVPRKCDRVQLVKFCSQFLSTTLDRLDGNK